MPLAKPNVLQKRRRDRSEFRCLAGRLQLAHFKQEPRNQRSHQLIVLPAAELTLLASIPMHEHRSQRRGLHLQQLQHQGWLILWRSRLH